MKMFFFDLELNQPSGTIIEIGACLGDIVTGEVTDTYQTYVRTDESIGEYINTLTGITDYAVSQGKMLDDAYTELMTFKSRADVIIAVQWGAGDDVALKAQVTKERQLPAHLGRSSIDAKKVFQSYCLANNMKYQGGLSKSMNKLGLRFQGTKHTALDDAINTFRIYNELLKRMRER